MLSHAPKFPSSCLISYFLALGTYLPFFFLGMLSCCPTESVSFPLADTYVSCDCLPDFRLSASLQPLACSYPSFHIFRLLDSPSNTELTSRGRNSFSVFQVQTRALTIGCPLGPECDFRIPMLNLNIPNTVLAQGPFHFPAQLCGSEAMPEHFARPVSDSWQILVSSERSCREQDLS